VQQQQQQQQPLAQPVLVESKVEKKEKPVKPVKVKSAEEIKQEEDLENVLMITQVSKGINHKNLISSKIKIL
jgi:hypothetical protein